MTFSNKQELIDFFKKQLNIDLKNIDGFCGNNSRLLYAEIPRKHRNNVLSYCIKSGIETCEHVNGKYWFYLDNADKSGAIAGGENEEKQDNN